MEDNNQSKWINTVLKELNTLGNKNAEKAIENCGRECLKSSDGYKQILNLRRSLKDVTDDDAIFKACKSEIYQNKSSIQKNGNNIFLEYQQCSCGMVTTGDVNHPFLCNCTVGYTKQIFETLFERPVIVELQKSILNGDHICRQKITLSAL